MKNTKVNLIHFVSVLSFSSLLLTVSALTDSTDAEAIDLLKTTFPLLGLLSTGDPCLPRPYLWVKCSSNFIPRITALNLHDSLLLTDHTLRLPDFSAMDALEIIDLSDNILQEEFPDFLANFPKLKVLNLANNFLTGTVPTSLRDKSKANTLKLTLTGVGMTSLCFSDEDSCGTKKGTGPGTGPGTGTGPGQGTGPGTGLGGSPGTNTGATPSISESRNKTLAIALGIGIPVFVIFWAIVAFLAIDHQKRMTVAAAGKSNETSGLVTPVYVDSKQQMPPSVTGI